MALDGLISFVHSKGAVFALDGLDPDLNATLNRKEYSSLLNADHFYPSVDDAIAAFRARSPVTTLSPRITAGAPAYLRSRDGGTSMPFVVAAAPGRRGFHRCGILVPVDHGYSPTPRATQTTVHARGSRYTEVVSGGLRPGPPGGPLRLWNINLPRICSC